MKYFRVFETESNYTDFVNGSDYVTPNLCVIRSTGGTKCKPYIPPPPAAIAGDIAYWDGSKVKTTPLSSWNTYLGTPVGVVVVPTGFAPDGKVRIVSLLYVHEDGITSTSSKGVTWAKSSIDTSLTNFTKVPITDNTGNISTDVNDYGRLPSDNFTVNKPFLNKIKDSFSYKDYKFINRYDAEFFPGYVFKDNGWGKGLTSHNNAKLKLEGMLGAFYNMNDELWDKILDVLGDKEEFYKFKKEILIKCSKL